MRPVTTSASRAARALLVLSFSAAVPVFSAAAAAARAADIFREAATEAEAEAAFSERRVQGEHLCFPAPLLSWFLVKSEPLRAAAHAEQT